MYWELLFVLVINNVLCSNNGETIDTINCIDIGQLLVATDCYAICVEICSNKIINEYVKEWQEEGEGD